MPGSDPDASIYSLSGRKISAQSRFCNWLQPYIFVSYSHADEPQSPKPHEFAWLTYVKQQFRALERLGVVEYWTDENLKGGADWDRDIKAALAKCDIFIILVSPNALGSRYILETEVAAILARQKDNPASTWPVLFPIIIESVAEALMNKLDWLSKPNRRPANGKALSDFKLDGSHNERGPQMQAILGDLLKYADEFESNKPVAPSGGTQPPPPPILIDTDKLPDAKPDHLRGREDDLAKLDAAWESPAIHVFSVIAFGGMGKTALTAHWVDGLVQAGGRGAAKILAWSFYSQGSHERTASADGFFDWAMDRLGLPDAGPSANAKAEAIAAALGRERILLILDGIEPLQHGPGPQQGLLKDPALRTLLRKAAQRPPESGSGLVLLTSRVKVENIKRWQDTSAPSHDLAQLSQAAGAQLLGDRGVKGPDRELRAAAQEFGGHALALTLLAEFLKRRHGGNILRRDRVGPMVAAGGAEIDRVHGHARRVLQSLETEWLAGEPLYAAIMRVAGLFDRRADSGCLGALQGGIDATATKSPHAEEPPKAASRSTRGLGESTRARRPRASRRAPSDRPHPEGSLATSSLIPGIEAFQRASETELADALYALRQSGLLLPAEDNDPRGIDAHPLVREFFGDKFRAENEAGWKAAHGRLYDFLRDSTKEGDDPDLTALEPLFQAIPHGCRAGRQQETLDDVYKNRICRRGPDGRLVFHAQHKLGAIGPCLAALAWFFDKPFETPHASLKESDKSWVVGEAAYCLGILGRQREALPAQRAALAVEIAAKNHGSAAIHASNLADAEAALGELAPAEASARQAVDLADAAGDEGWMMASRCRLASILAAAGRGGEARALFEDAGARQRKRQPELPLLYSMPGYWYCDFRLASGDFVGVAGHAAAALEVATRNHWVLDVGLDNSSLARAALGLALSAPPPAESPVHITQARTHCETAIAELRRSNDAMYIPAGLLARARLFRALGEWEGARGDLDEIEEICEPGPMRLHLCDMHIERCRLALARREGFAPLAQTPAAAPSPEAQGSLLEEARAALAEAAKLISDCGYHLRDEERDELADVIAGKRKFADLPPRV